MPLVIAVVAIITIMIVMHDHGKESDRRTANKAQDGRNTNAYLEHRLLDDYLKEGETFEDAYRMTVEALLKRNYEPCIPKEKYLRYEFFESSIVLAKEKGVSFKVSSDIGEYDSYIVQARRQRITNQIGHGGIDSFDPDTDYYTELKRSMLYHKTRFKPGDMIVYMTYGTCQVIDITYNFNRTKGWYIVKPLKKTLLGDPDEEFKIEIGDSNIRTIV